VFAPGSALASGTTVTGATDTTVPLEISPSAAAQSGGFGVGPSGPAFFIQNMPATRTVNTVTMGDFGLTDGCGYDDVTLNVTQSNDGEYGEYSSGVGSSSASIPASPGRVTWHFSPMTLQAGKGYIFWFSSDGWGPCAEVAGTTWQHNSAQVNGGSGSCAVAEDNLDGNTPDRYWHVQGQSDVPGSPSCPYGYSAWHQVADFDPSMPTGWLKVWAYSWYQPYVQLSPTWQLGPSSCASDGSEVAQPTSWTNPGDGKTYQVCTYPQFAAPGQQVSDGWYYVPALPTNGASPRDRYLQLSDAPTCSDVSASTQPGQATSVNLSCTSDATETYHIVSGPQNGTISSFDASAGTLTYTPNSGYTGTDTFTYDASQPGGVSQPATTVSVSVNTPSCQDVTANTTQDTSTSVGFNCANAVGGSYQIVSAPVNGTLGAIDQSAGAVTYTPAPGFYGTDSFSYRANAGGVASGVSHVTVNVAARSLANGPYPDELAGGSNPGASDLMPCLIADPVNCATGGLTESTSDLSVPGRGVALRFARTYNSMFAAPAGAVTGNLAPGWSTSYSSHLSFLAAISRVVVHQDDGATVTFEQQSDGTYTAGPYVTAGLVRNGDGSYTYTLANQVAYQFDSSGVLQNISDRNGYHTILSYSNGRLDHVTDPEGRSLQFSYDANGLLQSVTDPHRRSVSFTHDATGNLTSATDVAGHSTGYSYDTNHLLTVVQDARGNRTTNSYDDHYRVIAQTDRTGATTHFAYATDQTTITDPLGRVTVEHFSRGQLVSKTTAAGTSQQATWSYGYDADRNLASITAPNNDVTSYSYDAHGNLTQRQDAARNRTTITYTALNDPATVTDPNGETTTFAYDANGNLTGVSRPLQGSSDIARTDYTYDPNQPGDLIATTNPDGQSTHFQYDGNGDLSKLTDAQGDSTTFAYNDVGWLTSTVSARGNATGANPSDYQTTFARNAFGDLTSLTDPLGHQTTYTYDENGNLTSTTDPNQHTTSTSYDPENRPTTLTRPGGSKITTSYDAAGQPTQVTDGLSHPTAYAFNAAGELTDITDPLGRITHFNYDDNGRRSSATNARGQSTHYGYDPANHLVAITYSNASTPDVTFGYDGDGHRTQMTDGAGTSQWTYDSLGRMTAATSPAGGELSRISNGGTSAPLPGGGATLGVGSPETTHYAWDLANRLTAITYSDDSTVASAFNGTPTVTRTYDKAGRLASVADWLGQTTTFAYDPDGHLTEVDYPNATKAQHTYDRAGQITQTTDTGPAGSFLSIPYTRDPAGLLTGTGIVGANPTATETLGYDPVNRLTSETANLTAGAGLSRNAYAYDDGDRATTLSLLGVPLSASYDAADELTQTTEPNTQNSTATYSYDADGNRTAQTGPAGLTASYAYDQADRLIEYRNQGQNAANNNLPTTPTTSATDINYHYTGDGLLANLLWDRTTPVPEILADATNLYIYGPGGTPIEQVAPGGTISYIHTDQLGSTRALTDKNGRLLGLYDYDPYGNQTHSTNAVATPLGYAGQYTDPTTGLIYMRARWYDPHTAQFLTRDPLGLAAGSQDPYNYTNQNPTNLIDPLGLAGCDPAQAMIDALNQATLDLSIAAAQATAQAAISGSIEGADFAVADFGAEADVAFDEELSATEDGGRLLPRIAGGAPGAERGANGLFGENAVELDTRYSGGYVGQAGGPVRVFQTELQGGRAGAEEFFQEHTGQSVTGGVDVAEAGGSRFILRGSSSGAPTVEVFDPATATVEKIRFQ
jgi:RHS repeat-associated protein